MPLQRNRWRAFARETGRSLRERLERVAALTADERDHLSRRVEQAIQNALEVPAGLEQRIEECAARLIARSHNADLVAIAWSRTQERARRSAAIGAVTTLPAVVPGLGTALAALGLVADWRYVAEQQRNLVLEIAALFGQWPDNATEEARRLFLAATATAFAAPGAGRLATRALARQAARRGIARLLPGAGAAVAGALNYIATIALGRAAIEHFGALAGFEVRGIVPSQPHPALPWLRNALVDAVDTGRQTEVFSEEARRAYGELAAGEREELLDLAATLIVLSGSPPGREPLLTRLGTSLGFPASDIDRVAARALRSAQPVRQRLRDAFAAAISRSSSSVETAWRKVARLARRRARGPRPARKRRAPGSSRTTRRSNPV
jgi:hypothetical protein